MEDKQPHLETDFFPPLFFFKLGQEFRPHFLTSLHSLLACSPRPGAKALEEGSRLMSPAEALQGPTVERVHHVHLFSLPFPQLPQLLGSGEGGLESLHRDGGCLESSVSWGSQASENANGLAHVRAICREWLTGGSLAAKEGCFWNVPAFPGVPLPSSQGLLSLFDPLLTSHTC